jgi:hypothetical protein
MIWLLIAVVPSVAVILAGRAHSRHLDRIDERRRAIANLVGKYRSHQEKQSSEAFVPRVIRDAPSLAWNGSASLSSSWSHARAHEENNA